MRSGIEKDMTFKQGFSYIVRGYGIVCKLFPRYLSMSTALAVLHAVQPLATIYFSARILGELAGVRDLRAIALYAGLAVGAAFSSQLLVAALNRKINVHHNSTWHRLRQFRGKRYAEIDFEHVESRDVNELLAEINAKENATGLGIARLARFYRRLVQELCGVAVSSVLFIGMFTAAPGGTGSFITSPWATALLAASVVLPMAVRTAMMKHSLTVMARAHELLPASNSTALYYLDYIDTNSAGKDIRLYGQQPTVSALLQKADLKEFFVVMSNLESRTSGFTAAANAMVGALAYVLIGLRALAGMYGIGQVMQYVGAVGAFTGSLTSLISTAAMMWENAAYLPLLYAYLDLPSEKYKGTLTTEKRVDNDYEIEFHDVSFRYPGSDAWALQHLNLKLNIGERMAVVGMNGSGKTTMIKLLCRLYDPTEGRITLNGIDISKYDYDEYLALFSVVFQDFQLLAFPIGQNVAASVNCDEPRALEALKKVAFDIDAPQFACGLDTALYKNFDEDGVEVSGGEAQKIALARAIYKGAPFMILDEPTAALDPLAEYEIYSKFNGIVGQKTAVYISHRLSSCRFCHDIAVFHEGRLVQRGGHEALLADAGGKYHELWHAQARHYAQGHEG